MADRSGPRRDLRRRRCSVVKAAPDVEQDHFLAGREGHADGVGPAERSEPEAAAEARVPNAGVVTADEDAADVAEPEQTEVDRYQHVRAEEEQPEVRVSEHRRVAAEALCSQSAHARVAAERPAAAEVRLREVGDV